MAYASGYRLAFVERDESLVRELRASGRYQVRLVGDSTQDVLVEGFAAYSPSDEAVSEEIAACDLVLTAVLPENLPSVAPALGRGIVRRAELEVERPLNVVACENMIGGSTALHQHVLHALAPAYRGYLESHIGFPDAMVARVVPTPGSGRMLLLAEGYNEWSVDRHAFLGKGPAVEGLELVDNLEARLERKLFMHNTGHAVCGYLAHLKGYQNMCDAIGDPAIEPVVRGAMVESGEALICRHGFDRAGIERYREGFFPRVASPLILDPVSRVVRSPRRKLGRDERLVGPACFCLDYGIQPMHLALGIAALLRYRSPADPESLELQRLLAERGPGGVLADVAGLDLARYSRLVALVREGLAALASSSRDDAVV